MDIAGSGAVRAAALGMPDESLGEHPDQAGGEEERFDTHVA